MEAESEENNEILGRSLIAASIDAGDKNVLQNTNKRPYKSNPETL